MDDLNKALNHLFGFKIPIDDYDEFEKKVEEARELKEHLEKVEILKDIPQIITPVKMTNYDRIKSMSVVEMAKAIHSSEAESCLFCSNDKCTIIEENCIQGIIKWLLQEVSENE